MIVARFQVQCRPERTGEMAAAIAQPMRSASETMIPSGPRT
jgi:hypothetical protein